MVARKKCVVNILLAGENVQASYVVFILGTIYSTDLLCSVKSMLKYILFFLNIWESAIR